MGTDLKLGVIFGDYFMAPADPKKAQRLSSEAWIELTTRRESVVLIRDFELQFEVLIESAKEIEDYMVSELIKDTYSRTDARASERFWERLRIGLNVRLLAFLTATGLYLEQTKRLLPRVLDVENTTKTKFSTATKSQYDSVFEYRVMESLRNHAKHAALPIGGINLGSSRAWEGGIPNAESPSRSRQTMSPSVDVKSLLENKKIKPALRQELEEQEFATLDLKNLVRCYVSCLSACHLALLDDVQSAFNDSTEALLAARSECGLGTNHNGYVFLSETPDVLQANGQLISGDFYEGELKTGDLAQATLNMRDRYISSEINVSPKSYSGGKDGVYRPK